MSQILYNIRDIESGQYRGYTKQMRERILYAEDGSGLNDEYDRSVTDSNLTLRYE